MLQASENRYMRPKTAKHWTAEQVADLTRLWNDGYSASQIAASIGGISRSAVLGKVVRLKLAPRRPLISVAQKPRRLTVVSPSIFLRKLKPAKIVAAPPPVSPSLEHKVNFFSLDNHHCRYPLWDENASFHEQFYCGNPQANVIEGRTMCAFHQRLCFQPAVQK